jgi:hypothetical protein
MRSEEHLQPAPGALGEVDAGLIGIEDPGNITLTFSSPIFNGVGADLAVFENAWEVMEPPDYVVGTGYWFAELAYVEVSSDGVNFARFPSTSLNEEDDLWTDYGRDFAAIDITNTDNLAGIHASLVGTLFDLDDLLLDPLVIAELVDLDDIGFVRIVDIPGDGSFLDASGNPILDAWPTVGFGSGGHDLDAVAALHIVPEPGTVALMVLGLAGLGLCGRSRSVVS